MAEQKYNLLLVNTNTEKKKQSVPWYKERINTKFNKSPDKKDSSKFQVAKDWKFLKDGLDDFRDGLPPPISGDIIIQQDTAGLHPNAKSKNAKKPVIKQEVLKNRFTKEEVCFSKVPPLEKKRKENLDEIEYGLTQHPLALYSHLEESVPPDVYEQVVDLLDPEMNLIDDGTLGDNSTSSKEQRAKSIMIQTNASSSVGSRESTAGHHFYSWIPSKDDISKDDPNKQAVVRPPADLDNRNEHIQNVTKDFCNWVGSLGGETNNIEESTVSSLFASGYETKPALSVPIHVVELTSIPQELRQNIPNQSMPTAKREIDQQELDMQEEYRRRLEGSDKSWMKFRYGAWYLDPKEWKKLGIDEPLVDPETLKDTRQTEAKKRSQDMNETLSHLHSSKAFMEFLNHKGTRKPECSFYTRAARNIQLSPRRLSKDRTRKLGEEHYFNRGDCHRNSKQARRKTITVSNEETTTWKYTGKP